MFYKFTITENKVNFYLKKIFNIATEYSLLNNTKSLNVWRYGL